MDSKLETARWAAAGETDRERGLGLLSGEPRTAEESCIHGHRKRRRREEKTFQSGSREESCTGDGAGPSLRVQATSSRRLGRGQASAAHHLKPGSGAHTLVGPVSPPTASPGK